MKEPAPQLIRSPEDAERVAADWMEYWGYSDATPQDPGPDGGVDIRSSKAVAQVKAEMRPIGRPVVQQLAGIALYEKVDGLFFSLSGFTPHAEEWASDAGIALFTFDLQGVPTPVNSVAEDLTARAAVESKPRPKKKRSRRKKLPPKVDRAGAERMLLEDLQTDNDVDQRYVLETKVGAFVKVRVRYQQPHVDPNRDASCRVDAWWRGGRRVYGPNTDKNEVVRVVLETLADSLGGFASFRRHE